MSKPIIIFGAGASYDYVQENSRIQPIGFKPPLANHLFDTNFEKIIKQTQEVTGLATSVISALRQGVGLEDFLVSIQGKSGANADRQRQLVSFLFYLQNLFRQVTSNFGNQYANNYREIVNQIRDNGGEACVINFNYDLLFEQATGYKITDIRDFVSQPIKIIKIHGAYNWTKVLPNAFRIRSDGNTYSFLMASPDYLIKNPSKDTDPIYIQDNYDMTDGGGDRYFFYPWIAIPISGKSSFVCPSDHLTILRQSLKQADRILIVGWKAADRHLVKLMEEEIQQPVQITIVSGSGKTVKEVQDKLAGIKKVTFPNSVAKFSDFVGSQVCQDFFQTK